MKYNEGKGGGGRGKERATHIPTLTLAKTQVNQLYIYQTLNNSIKKIVHLLQ